MRTARHTRRVVLATATYSCLLATFAGAQALSGRFFPEKQVYLVGEPVFISFEIVNKDDQSVWIDGRLGEPCIERDTIEVVGAKFQGFGSDTSFGCFGGVAGSCASGLVEIRPGEKHVAQVFLSPRFKLDHAGTYEVRAKRRVPTFPDGVWVPLESAINAEFSADLQVTLVKGTDDQLKVAFQPYVENVQNPDYSVRRRAIQAIEEVAPTFLEGLIIELAETPNSASPAALRRLNTPKAKQNLAEIAEFGEQGGNRQEAIRELAKARDPSYLPVLIRVARTSSDGDRDFAIWGAGLLGGDSAVPFLKSMLADPDLNIQIAAVRGLGVTASRSAVPILIDLLRYPDARTFREITQSLTQLTRRSISPQPWQESLSADSYRRWSRWWKANEQTAPIYSTENCVPPEPFE